LTEGANLTDFDERTGRFHPDNVRVVTCLNFPAWFATAAGADRFLSGSVGDFPGTIARHRKGHGRAFFAHSFYSCKQKGVRDGPILKEGS
jgi:hypothetical protein